MSRDYDCNDCYDSGKRHVLDCYQQGITVPCHCLIEKYEDLLQKVLRLEAQAAADPGNATVLKSANPASARTVSLTELRTEFPGCKIEAGRHYVVRGPMLVDAGDYTGEDGWVAVKDVQLWNGL